MGILGITMSCWMKKLPPRWKAKFEKIAKDDYGDEGRGNGARLVERVLREFLKERS